jgi:thiamine pyrophosphokinase
MLPQHIRSVLVLNGGSYSDFKSLYHVALGSQEDFFEMLQPNSMLSFQLNNKTGTEFILVQSDDIEEAKFHLFNCLNSTFETIVISSILL